MCLVLEGHEDEGRSTRMGFLTMLRHRNLIPGGPWELLRDLVGGSDIVNIDSAKEGGTQ